MAYRFSVDECDVVEKASLPEFRRKLDEWTVWLRGDDEHSISNQLVNMLWNDAVFRLLNEARRLASVGSIQSAALNRTLRGFVDQGYVATQALSIRRLVEKPASKPDRQAISIRRLLSDIRQHRHLLTRENLVCHDGLPYDYERVRAMYYEALVAHGEDIAGRLHGIESTGPRAWYSSELAHAAFDRLAGGCNGRQRSELVHLRIFEQISHRIGIAEVAEIETFADKFIAHASDPTSRFGLSEKERTVTLSKLEACHRALMEAAEMISSQLLFGSRPGGVPTPQFDHLEFLDLPWLPAGDLQSLRDFWRRHAEHVENWRPPQLSVGDLPL